MKKLIILFLYLFVFSHSHAYNIMYIGDSHSYGEFGKQIYKSLSVISPDMSIQASCGATAKTWLGEKGHAKTNCGYWKKDANEEFRSKDHFLPIFDEDLSKYNPDVVIVQLGTNIAVAKNPQNASSSIDLIMSKIQDSGAKCIWIGPPDAKHKLLTKSKLNTVNAMIESLAKKYSCEYIDSLKITKFPEQNLEGIHYPPSLSRAWGLNVSNMILKILEK